MILKLNGDWNLQINMVFPIKAMFSSYHKVAIVPREGFVTISFSERYMPKGKEIMKTKKTLSPRITNTSDLTILPHWKSYDQSQ